MTGAPQNVEEFTDNELLYRQVHPSFVQNNRVTSQAFKPTPKDSLKLSVSRSAKTDARAAYAHHTQTLNLQSDGVWAVEVKEVNEIIEPPPPSRINSDPTLTPAPDPSHSNIDFTGLSTSQINSVAKKLSVKAQERGKIHPK